MPSNKFILREWQLSDSESLARNASNIRIWNNAPDSFPHPYTNNDGVAYISKNMTKRPATNLAIIIDGEAAGGIGIVPQSDVDRITAELGYWLGESYWNRGIMSEAVKEVTKYSFTNFPISKLYATVYEYNTASMKVLEKAGFTKEAVLKKGIIKNGKIIDLHYFSLIKTDWEQQIRAQIL